MDNGAAIPTRKVAIIGAGYAGLCALRHFVEDKQFVPVIFEKDSDIGGIWRIPGSASIDYDAYARLEGSGIDHKKAEPYNPMYENLQSNSPRDMTAFLGFPFPKQGTSSYFKPAEFMQYFRAYVKAFDLLRHIKLRHEVTIVEPTSHNTPFGPQWKLRWRDRNTEEVGEDVFDVVIVCNGHHDKSFVPEISGLKNFKGPIIHSNRYKTARVYQDKTVLVVGGSYSANDLVSLLQPVAKKVIASRRKLETLFAPFSNVQETDLIKEYGSDFIILGDGTQVHIDAIILCTGYDYYFPFLAETCHVQVENARVKPLYRHVIHIEYPSMAFTGLLDYVAYTPTCDIQVKFYKAFLGGKVQLPTKEAMTEDAEKDYQKQLTNGLRHAHKLNQNVWEYMDKLAVDGGFPTYDPAVRKIFDYWADLLHTQPHSFRKYRAEQLDSENCYLEPVPVSTVNGAGANGHT